MNEFKDYSDKKVLYIDDSSTSLTAGMVAFKKFNIEVDKGYNMAELFEHVRTNEYDLIVLDDMMPELRISGTSAMQKLKMEGYSKPIIVLTGNDAPTDRKSYLDEGFDEYLSKPINLVKLAEILHKFWD